MAITDTPSNRLIARFRTSTLERLKRIQHNWVTLTEGAKSSEQEAELRRDVHTVKGDSRVIGFVDINLICQKLEDLIGFARKRDYRVPNEVDIVVTLATHLIEQLVLKQAGMPVQGGNLARFVAQVEEALRDAETTPGGAQEASTVPTQAGSSSSVVGEPPPQRAPQRRLAVAATNIFLESLGGPARGTARLRRIWRVLKREIAEAEITGLRPLLFRFVKAGSDLAQQLGKRVDVVLEVDDVSVESRLAEALEVAVLHMVRNAVDHGIEDPPARTARGKSEIGEIRIAARILGEELELVVADDGKGLDLPEIRHRASEMGLWRPGREAADSEAEVLGVLFQPGFTTRERVSETSGRGIGLNAVKAALDAFGGKIEVWTKTEEGTTLTLRIPHRTRWIDVYRFVPLRSGVVFAAPADWTPTAEPGFNISGGIDLLKILGIRTAELKPARLEQPQVLRFRRGEREIRVLAGTPATRARAHRSCPTGDEHPVEVVSINETECILIRPDRLDTAREAAGEALTSMVVNQ